MEIVTPETVSDLEQDIRWFERAYAPELAALRKRMEEFSGPDRETFLVARCLRLEHERNCLRMKLQSLESMARDLAKLSKLAREGLAK